MPLLRRKRLPDGTFGPLEKVFEGETVDEKITQLEAENANLILQLIEKDLKLSELEQTQANLTLELIVKGVL